jgi:CrcB protein
MRNFLLVGAGGFVGSVARFYLTGAVTRLTSEPLSRGNDRRQPAGCFAIGVLAGLAERRHVFTHDTRLFLLTGLLGGFTTFSAFAYETYFLGREHAWPAAFANVAIQVILGLALLVAGRSLVTA